MEPILDLAEHLLPTKWDYCLSQPGVWRWLRLRIPSSVPSADMIWGFYHGMASRPQMRFARAAEFNLGILTPLAAI